MSSRQLAIILAAALAAPWLGGCGETPEDADENRAHAQPLRDEDGVVDLPGDSRPGDDVLDAVTHGVLAGDPEEGCVWLEEEIEEGEPIDPEMALVWPAGFRFDTSTLEILNPDGDRVAAIGDYVRLAGAETPHLTPEWCDIADRVWAVASIQRL